MTHYPKHKQFSPPMQYYKHSFFSQIKVVSSNPGYGEVCLIQHYVINFVSDLRKVCVFCRYSDTSTNKTDHYDMTEILLKVALNTITLSLRLSFINHYLLFHAILQMIGYTHLFLEQTIIFLRDKTCFRSFYCNIFGIPQGLFSEDILRLLDSE